jgi:hypothetical protein
MSDIIFSITTYTSALAASHDPSGSMPNIKMPVVETTGPTITTAFGSVNTQYETMYNRRLDKNPAREVKIELLNKVKLAIRWLAKEFS